MDAHSQAVGAFPLLLASEGERVRVIALRQGRDLERRMSDIGLTVGSEVTVLQRQSAGAMVVARDDLRLAISSGVAHRLLVVRVPDPIE